MNGSVRNTLMKGTRCKFAMDNVVGRHCQYTVQRKDRIKLRKWIGSSILGVGKRD